MITGKTQKNMKAGGKWPFR